MRSLDLSVYLIILSNRSMALTEMSTRNLTGGKGWPVHKTDVTALDESIAGVGNLLSRRVKNYNLRNFKVFKEPQNLFLPTINSTRINKVF
jgi:hypothetical protein